jgi:hypothetical protein
VARPRALQRHTILALHSIYDMITLIEKGLGMLIFIYCDQIIQRLLEEGVDINAQRGCTAPRCGQLRAMAMTKLSGGCSIRGLASTRKEEGTAPRCIRLRGMATTRSSSGCSGRVLCNLLDASHPTYYLDICMLYVLFPEFLSVSRKLVSLWTNELEAAMFNHIFNHIHYLLHLSDH